MGSPRSPVGLWVQRRNGCVTAGFTGSRFTVFLSFIAKKKKEREGGSTPQAAPTVTRHHLPVPSCVDLGEPLNREPVNPSVMKLGL
jgi:hypothetical protein